MRGSSSASSLLGRISKESPAQKSSLMRDRHGQQQHSSRNEWDQPWRREEGRLYRSEKQTEKGYYLGTSRWSRGGKVGAAQGELAEGRRCPDRAGKATGEVAVPPSRVTTASASEWHDPWMESGSVRQFPRATVGFGGNRKSTMTFGGRCTAAWGWSRAGIQRQAKTVNVKTRRRRSELNAGRWMSRSFCLVRSSGATEKFLQLTPLP